MSHSRKWILLSLAIMVLWIGQMAYLRMTGTEVEVKIQGYDPRDLLSGHYLRFRLDLGEVKCPLSGPKVGCICLRDQSAYWGGVCEERPSDCHTFIRAACRYGAFHTGLDRFYFSERFAGELSRVPQNATAVLRVDRQGNAIVTGIKVEGVPLREYLNKPNSRP